MKNLMRIILILFAVISLNSCGMGLSLTKKNMMSVEKGMSKAEVKSILGTPDDRSFDGDDEGWRYFSGVYVRTFVVHFYGDRVVGLETF